MKKKEPEFYVYEKFWDWYKRTINEKNDDKFGFYLAKLIPFVGLFFFFIEYSIFYMSERKKKILK